MNNCTKKLVAPRLISETKSSKNLRTHGLISKTKNGRKLFLLTPNDMFVVSSIIASVGTPCRVKKELVYEEVYIQQLSDLYLENKEKYGYAFTLIKMAQECIKCNMHKNKYLFSVRCESKKCSNNEVVFITMSYIMKYALETLNKAEINTYVKFDNIMEEFLITCKWVKDGC